MNLGRRDAARIGGPLAAFVRVAHFVGTIEAGAAVPEEGRAGLVPAIDNEKRKAGKRPLDNVDLPISQDRILGGIPIVAVTLALAKGQVVDYPGRERVVHVERREAPVSFIHA